MAINPAANPALLKVVIHLQKRIRVANRSSPLVIPSDILNNALRSQARVDIEIIAALVNLFDGYNKGNCSRLNVAAYHCILHILLSARPCSARERGLHLFLESLKAHTNAVQNSRDESIVEACQQRKSRVAQKACGPLLQMFIDGNAYAPRRRSGEFVLELIRASPSNKSLLTTSVPANLRKIGGIVLTEPDHGLAFVAGAIIREMLDAQFDPSLLWPHDANKPVVARFPSTRLTDSDWIKATVDFFRYLHIQQNPGTPASVRVVQSLQIQGLTHASPSPSPIGLILLNPITFVIPRDRRLLFVDVPIGSISALRVLGESIHLLLKHDGHYAVNGISRWANQVSIGLGDARSAGDIAATIDEMVNGPSRRIRTLAGFVIGENPEPPALQPTRNRTYNPSRGGSAFLALPGYEDSTGFDYVDMAQTVGEGFQVRTSNTRRQPSFASLELPTGDDVATESENYIRRNSHSRLELADTEPLEPIAQVRGTESPVSTAGLGDENPEGSGREAEGSGSEKSANCVPESQGESNPVPQDGSECDELQVAPSSQARQVTSVGTQRGGHEGRHDGLPLLAQQALQLRASENRSPLTTEEPEQQASGPGHDPPPSVAPSPVENRSDGLTEEGTDVQVVACDSSKVFEYLNSVEEQDLPISKSGPAVETEKKTRPRRLSSSQKNSRLRRPRHRIRRARVRKRSFDWYQDLRVDGDEQPTASKKARCAPANAALRSVDSKTKPSPEKPLQAKAVRIKGANTGKKKRITQEVAKTLASARRSRVAAQKAKEKLCKTSEKADLAYDPDDPIESSSPAVPDAHVDNTVPHSDCPDDASLGFTGDEPVVDERQAEDTPAQGALQEGVQRSDTVAPKPSNGAAANPTTAFGILAIREKEKHKQNTDEALTMHPDKVPTTERSIKDTPDEMSLRGATKQSLGQTFRRVSAAGSTKEVQASHGKAFKDTGMPFRHPRGGQPVQSKEISDLSSKVSQFISRQKASTVEQNMRAAEQTTVGNAEGPSHFAAVHAPATVDGGAHRQHGVQNNVQKKTEQSKYGVDDTNADRQIDSEDSDEAAQSDGNLIVEDDGTEEADSVNLDLKEQGDGPVPSEGDAQEYDATTQMASDAPDIVATASSLGRNTPESSPKSGHLSEASTLIPSPEIGTSHARGDNSSSLCELTKEEFMSCYPASLRSNSTPSSVVEESSPCPKGREPREGWDAVLKKIAAGKEKRECPSTPTPVAAGLGRLDARNELQGTEELMTSDSEEGATENLNGQASVRGSKEQLFRPHGMKPAVTKVTESSRIKKRIEAPAVTGVQSAFAERLKAAGEASKTGTFGSRTGIWANRDAAVVSSSSDQDESSSDPSSQTDTATPIYTQSIYSSDDVSQEQEPQAAENEWLNALRASQRTSLDILLDTSHRLIRNMVDEEKAITSVVDTYKNGCNRILNQMIEVHDENLAYAEQERQGIQTEVVGRCKAMLERLEGDEDGQNGDQEDLAAEADKRLRTLIRQIENATKECEIEGAA